MRLVDLHESATRCMDIEACANLIFHAASLLADAYTIEIERATDGAGGFYVKVFGDRGVSLGLLSGA